MNDGEEALTPPPPPRAATGDHDHGQPSAPTRRRQGQRTVQPSAAGRDAPPRAQQRLPVPAVPSSAPAGTKTTTRGRGRTSKTTTRGRGRTTKTAPPARSAPSRMPSPCPPPMPSAMSSASAMDGATDAAYDMFDQFPPSELYNGVESYVSMLNDASDVNGIDLSMPYEDLENDGAEEEHEVEVEDNDGGEDEASRMIAGRSKNFTVQEDIALVLAWESVTLDAIIWTNQNSNNYWGRIEDHYYRNVSADSNRSRKSLSGRWTLIKECCNRWSSCVAQVERIPPSGAQLTDHVAYCQARYKDMPKSNGKAFMFHHCWELLKNNVKWQRRKDEAPPKRSRSIASSSPDVDDSVDGSPGTDTSPAPNSERPDGTKTTKTAVKKAAELSSCRERIDEMINVRKEVADQIIKSRLELAEARKQEKLARWQEIKENEEMKQKKQEENEAHRQKKEEEYEACMVGMAKRKAAREERRLLIEERTEESRIMLMDPTKMDDKARAFWEMSRDEILAAKKARMAGKDNNEGDQEGGSE